MSPSGLAQCLDVSYDCGTSNQRELSNSAIIHGRRQTRGWSSQSPLEGRKTVLSRVVKKTRKTYVFHEPREGNRLTSIFQTYCLQRTKWMFPLDRPCTRRCDLSRGRARLVEKSIFERLLVSSSLWRGFSLPDRGNVIGIGDHEHSSCPAFLINCSIASLSTLRSRRTTFNEKCVPR